MSTIGRVIRSRAAEPKAWLGCKMHDVGLAIAHAGDHLHGLCDCKD